MTDKELHTVSVCVCVLVQMCVWLGVWMGGGGGVWVYINTYLAVVHFPREEIKKTVQPCKVVLYAGTRGVLVKTVTYY